MTSSGIESTRPVCGRLFRYVSLAASNPCQPLTRRSHLSGSGLRHQGPNLEGRLDRPSEHLLDRRPRGRERRDRNTEARAFCAPVVGHRVGFVHQRCLWIVRAAFALSWNDAADVPGMLRALTDANVVDLRTGMPQLAPPTTRLAYAVRCLGELNDALAVALSLASSTGDAHRLEALDRAVRSNTFDTWLRTAAANPQIAVVSGGVLADTAADVLDAIQEQFRYFAKRAGDGWNFGQLGD